ncbi:extracellular solute-binding protein [Microlunatus parietis]|uniref:Putative aldouronate transport system substrate-binding protein n=1 Tax=Microlunatus parietis TaxID=682979 RepID=A0A7Y9IE13_9ACTN|nr:extracellular solute-binding protein [Microlunatus parietis]NYE74798.1 putative aldouronate transport system substrate-binding protein [Microlunatus parietis]
MENPTQLDRESRTLTRRSLIKTATLAGGALAVGTSAACTPDKTIETNQGAANVNAQLPSYTPVELIKPDLPGDQVLMPGYYAYPRDPKPVFDSPPGAGLDKITIMYPTFIAAPPGPDRNTFYAQVQTEIGAQLELQPIPSADYAPKFQTMVAGGSLPDVMMFPLPTPDQPRVMERLFENLGPYLAGDKINDFPYLANIPEASWKPTVSNGTVYAVPQPRSVAGGAMYYRRDLFEQLQVDPEPASYAEFVELCKAVTDPKQSRWAMANAGNARGQIAEMLGAPNGWSESGGEFTNAYADERTKESVARTAELIKAGLLHPDAASASYTQFRDFFFAGRTVLLSDGYAGWDLFVRQLGGVAEGTEKLGLMMLPKYDGGGDAPHFAGTGFQAITVIKKGLGEERTRGVLNVLNYLAAPIGSAEHLHRKYGVEGQDFTWENDLPTLTQQGTTNFLDLQYIVDAPTILGPGPRDGVDRQHAWHQRATADPVRDPTIGLYSDTASRKANTLGKLIGDVVTGIMFGRNPLSDYDEAFAKWRSEGGDKIAAEYAEAFTAANG